MAPGRPTENPQPWVNRPPLQTNEETEALRGKPAKGKAPRSQARRELGMGWGVRASTPEQSSLKRSFIHAVAVEHPLRAPHCSGPWGKHSEQDNSCSQSIIIIELQETKRSLFNLLLFTHVTNTY